MVSVLIFVVVVNLLEATLNLTLACLIIVVLNLTHVVDTTILTPEGVTTPIPLSSRAKGSHRVVAHKDLRTRLRVEKFTVTSWFLLLIFICFSGILFTPTKCTDEVDY